MLEREGEPVAVAARLLGQDDVDRAGDGFAAQVGGGGAQQFDPFDLVRPQRGRVEARRRGAAVDQHLGVALAEPAQGDRTAAGAVGHRHAGQPLERVGQGVVAVAGQFVAGDDDARGGVVAARVVVLRLHGDGVQAGDRVAGGGVLGRLGERGAGARCEGERGMQSGAA
nr:hypothetical protein [Lysobacter enzymogenes]